ncbi:MAG: hypothetical protein K0S67_1859 [Nitrososphaeraceae archaeon]|nr:hypothetical protein [Nitrososphaeraceae archaeon]MDF2767437.1 hypothetical protein [Nitrososphaeraceae archaeon]
MQPKLFVIHLLLVGISLVGLIDFSQVFTSIATATASEMKDMELEDEAIRQELEPIETEEIGDEEEDNTAKQEDEGKEEEEESDDDIPGTELEEDIMIDDNDSSDDDVPLELPFDTPMPFP